MGIHQAEVPVWGTGPMVSRLPGQSLSWRTCELRPKPLREEQARWRQRRDPFGMCSWPPEDERIESFHRHVRDQAKAIIGADLARTEKFTTSIRDGIDIRETLRNWHTRDLYVKVVPPSRGSIEVVLFLFDVPADPELYTNRTTWYAEHHEESTLAYYATDPMKNLVGPGIAQAEYGGALFLFPPRLIPDVWTDPRLDFTDTLEERLLAAGFLHSQDRHVAVVSPKLPPASWRRLARRFGRKIVHLPLKRFSGQLLERLRTFHVLNGKPVRSYAADFIRDTMSPEPVCWVRGNDHEYRVALPTETMPMSSVLLLATMLMAQNGPVPELPPTEPFEAPKYGVATRIPKAWTIAEPRR